MIPGTNQMQAAGASFPEAPGRSGRRLGMAPRATGPGTTSEASAGIGKQKGGRKLSPADHRTATQDKY